MCVIGGLPEELDKIIGKDHEKHTELAFLLQKVFDTGFTLGRLSEYPEKYNPSFWEEYTASGVIQNVTVQKSKTK